MGVFFTFLKLYKWYQIAQRTTFKVGTKIISSRLLSRSTSHIINLHSVNLLTHSFLKNIALTNYTILSNVNHDPQKVSDDVLRGAFPLYLYENNWSIIFETKSMAWGYWAPWPMSQENGRETIVWMENV